MQYEIYLRSRSPSVQQAKIILEELDQRDGLSVIDAGHRLLESSAGEVTVTLFPDDEHLWSERGEPMAAVGLDLRIPGGAGRGLAAFLTETAFDWAKRWGCDVFDPQLGRVVDPADGALITDRIKRHADYLTDTVGLDGRGAARYIDVDSSRPPLSWRTKFYLALGLTLILLALTAHYCN